MEPNRIHYQYLEARNDNNAVRMKQKTSIQSIKKNFFPRLLEAGLKEYLKIRLKDIQNGRII